MKKNEYYNVFIKVITLIAVLKTTENHIVLHVKAIIVITFGVSVCFPTQRFFDKQIKNRRRKKYKSLKKSQISSIKGLQLYLHIFYIHVPLILRTN